MLTNTQGVEIRRCKGDQQAAFRKRYILAELSVLRCSTDGLHAAYHAGVVLVADDPYDLLFRVAHGMLEGFDLGGIQRLLCEGRRIGLRSSAHGTVVPFVEFEVEGILNCLGRFLIRRRFGLAFRVRLLIQFLAVAVEPDYGIGFFLLFLLSDGHLDGLSGEILVVLIADVACLNIVLAALQLVPTVLYSMV